MIVCLLQHLFLSKQRNQKELLQIGLNINNFDESGLSKTCQNIPGTNLRLRNDGNQNTCDDLSIQLSAIIDGRNSGNANRQLTLVWS
jgi:hypothetical protein